MHCAPAYGVRKKSPHSLPSTYALPHAQRVPQCDVLGYYQPSRFAGLEHREFECIATHEAWVSSSVWTIVTVLSILAPRSRVIGALIVLLLCAAVVINNYHWLGDVVAGVFLGASMDG